MARKTTRRALTPAADAITVSVAPKPVVNRVLAQHDEPIFDAFLLKKEKRGVAEHVRIDVVLHTGAAPIQHSTTVTVAADVVDLRENIRLPLGFLDASGSTGRVRTSLLVQVTWGDVELYRKTHAISVVAPSEWVSG